MGWLFTSMTEDSEGLACAKCAKLAICSVELVTTENKSMQSMVRVEPELGTSGLQVQRSSSSVTLPSN